MAALVVVVAVAVAFVVAVAVASTAATVIVNKYRRNQLVFLLLIFELLVFY